MMFDVIFHPTSCSDESTLLPIDFVFLLLARHSLSELSLCSCFVRRSVAVRIKTVVLFVIQVFVSMKKVEPLDVRCLMFDVFRARALTSYFRHLTSAIFSLVKFLASMHQEFYKLTSSSSSLQGIV